MSICPKCGSSRTKKNGTSRGYQRYKCNGCGKEWGSQSTSVTVGVDGVTSSSQEFEELNYKYIDSKFTDTDKPPTLDELLDSFEIDRGEWEVTHFKVNKWDVAAKYEVDGKIHWSVHTNYQAKATLIRKNPVKCLFPTIHGAVVKPINFNKVKFPKGDLSKCVVVPDLQVGYKRDMQTFEMTPLHDLSALGIVTQVIKDVKPDKVVLLGDMLDLPDWSTHYLVRPEFTFTTQASLDFLAGWIADIRPYCKDMIYIEGNHEKRMIDSIAKNTIQAYGIRPANEPSVPPILSIPYLLGLHKMDVEYVGDYPHGEYYINDNLVCIHGNKVGAKSGQSVTKLLENARVSIITGHTHRLEMAHKTIWTHHKPKIYQAVTLGTLASLDGIVPSGSTRHNWQQGFGVVEYDEESFYTEIVGIYEGRCIYRGKVYES
jgi:metallophosphoesterase superfamily enzyme|tara:strand:+ start:1193 stop:2479 length:1287 start_codon:yes stop_codon:yes gene_type:complete